MTDAERAAGQPAAPVARAACTECGWEDCYECDTCGYPECIGQCPDCDEGQ